MKKCQSCTFEKNVIVGLNLFCGVKKFVRASINFQTQEVSLRMVMIYTSFRCVLKTSLSLIKIRSHLFGKPVLVCQTEKASILVRG